jgi:multidrug efflux pump subunit AcrA (membrane-fusion protein)
MNQKKSAEEKYYATLNDLTVSLQNARSQLASAKNDLDNYIIRSKNAGTVFQTFKEEGEAVRANDVIALLGKTSERIIRLAIDQQDIEKVKPGQDVLLRTDVTGNTIYHATIRSIYPIMNETDQTFRADAVFTGNAQQPYIHSSVEANIVIQKKEHVLLVPKKALLSNDSVRLLRNGRLTIVALKTGIRNLDEVEVLSGLDASSQIVLTVPK